MKKIHCKFVRLFIAVLVSWSLCVGSLMSLAQPVISLQEEVSGLNQPVQVVSANDGTRRIFIVEKEGAIQVYDENYASLGTFLSLTGIATTGEQGLLSLVFHPQFESNGQFFVYYTTSDGDLQVMRYTMTDPSSNDASGADRQSVLLIPHPGQTNHNGGEMHFGKDGFLYLSTGDGGGANDVLGNAQNTSVLLGKILRLNVDIPAPPNAYSIPAGNPFGNEVFALGLRNPFRWSFDRQTGDLWIGDVGQDAWEEINYTQEANAVGANYGWRCYEADQENVMEDCAGATYQFPVHSYAIPSGAPRSVVGGVVYRGDAMPFLRGYYLGADYFSGELHVVGPEGAGRTVYTQSSSWTGIADFGETESGEILAVSLTAGVLYSVDANDPLPVRLVKFEGRSTSEGTELTWQTSVEENSLQFDIEMSKDAKHFSPVGSVVSRNELNGSSYRFQHATYEGGTLYYRLKMIDRDGRYLYSGTVAVQSLISELGSGVVRPTVVRDGRVHLYLENAYQSVQLISMNGIPVYEQDLKGKVGRVEIAVNDVTSGLYIIKLEGDGLLERQKVVVIQ